MEIPDLSCHVILVTFFAAGSYLIWSSSTNTMSTSYLLSLPTNEVPTPAESTAIGLLAHCVIKINPFHYLGFQGHPVLIPLILKVSHYFLTSAHFIITAYIFVPTSLMEISGWIKIFWCFRWVWDRFFCFHLKCWNICFHIFFLISPCFNFLCKETQLGFWQFSLYSYPSFNIFQAIILFHSFQAFDCPQ